MIWIIKCHSVRHNLIISGKNTRKTVTGIICDLSASMRDNAGKHDIADEERAFLHTFVFECLPTSCRNWDNNSESDGGIW